MRPPQPNKTAGRRSFSYLRRTVNPATGKYIYSQVNDPRIDALNASFKADASQLNLLVRQGKALREALYREDERNAGRGDDTYLSDNLQFLDKFWAEHTKRKRLHIDPRSTFAEYRRAVEALGQLPLMTAHAEDMNHQIRRDLRGDKQRRVVIRLRTILRHFGREAEAKRLVLDHPDEIKVAHVSPLDYRTIREQLPNWEDKVICDCLVYTGMRTGELFASKPDDLKGHVLLVQQQLDRRGVLRKTKNRKSRKAFVFPEGVSALAEFYALSAERRNSLRKREWSSVLRAACRRAFPGAVDKSLCAHDLRHCYVIWLLAKGVSLTNAAKFIGDNVAVADRHYAGFSASDDAVNTAAKLVLP